ncbi:4'-phosphopantetheinyl transferase family protein [Haliea sp. E17]|uniref:4'-phosphopantetheinyl transferase family protein n=1 Tax=Haliea sp. E17 TaxID=3401576 RepID=UPI003AACE757
MQAGLLSLPAGEIQVWLCARATIADSDQFRRQVLSRYCAVPPGDWQFSSGRWGKPDIAAPAAPLRFNLSHSGDWLAMAVAAGGALGIDLERIKPGRDVLRLARRFYHPLEIEALETRDPAERDAAFHDLWTLKEAHVKCRGLALPPLLQQLAFACPEPGAIASDIARRDTAEDASVYALVDCLPGYRLALNWLRDASDSPEPVTLRLKAFVEGEMKTPWPASGLRASTGSVELVDELPTG